MNRENYDFELVDHDDLDDERGMNGGAAGVGGRGGRKKRAGELYDAFAEGTDDEDEFGVEDKRREGDGEVFDLGSDSDEEDGSASGRAKEGRYRDEEPR